MEEAERLTMLFPIKMALSILPESSVMRSTRSARLSPSSARVRIRILFTVVRAVSAEEKNAERKIKTIKKIIWDMAPASKYVHLN